MLPILPIIPNFVFTDYATYYATDFLLILLPIFTDFATDFATYSGLFGFTPNFIFLGLYWTDYQHLVLLGVVFATVLGSSCTHFL